jgi:hypothetical protein
VDPDSIAKIGVLPVIPPGGQPREPLLPTTAESWSRRVRGSDESFARFSRALLGHHRTWQACCILRNSQRMPVTRIFEARDHGLGCANSFREFSLRKFGPGAKLVNLPSDVEIGAFHRRRSAKECHRRPAGPPANSAGIIAAKNICRNYGRSLNFPKIPYSAQYSFYAVLIKLEPGTTLPFRTT